MQRLFLCCGMAPTFPPERVSFIAYDSIPAKWIISFRNSVLLATGTAILAAILGTLAALALSRGRFRTKELPDSVLRIRRPEGLARASSNRLHIGSDSLTLELGHSRRSPFASCPLIPDSDRRADIPKRSPRAMCGRLRVGKENLHVALRVDAAMCSAC